MADEEAHKIEESRTFQNSVKQEPSNSVIKRDHLLQWMEFSVSEPEKRIGGSSVKMQDNYVVYLVETKVTDREMPGYGNPPKSLWRRYNEFELLRYYLEIMYPHIVIPPLPEKKVSHTWQKLPTDRFDPEFIERRRAGLENFLLRVASHSILCKDPIFHGFYRKDENWKESVYATDFQSKALGLNIALNFVSGNVHPSCPYSDVVANAVSRPVDSRLKALSVSMRLKKPDPRFEELMNYSNELQTYINDILKIRAKLTDRIYAIHKLHANYGRVFNEWSAIEREMNQGLHTAGHFMDVYASCIDPMLEDEEQFADQLKEYYAFGESLRTLCKKQRMLQYEIEQLEDGLAYKNSCHQSLVQGKTNTFSLSGVKTKLFGVDNPEQREQKMELLQQQIAENKQQLLLATQQTEVFVELALKDIDRFKRQKVKDLKEVFINYAIMQMDRSKKGITVWQNAKDCFSKM